jgi:hypothetical protein
MRLRPFFPIIAVLTAVLLLASEAPAAGVSSPRGDVNCSTQTDAQDALDLMLTLAGKTVDLDEGCARIGVRTVDGVGGDVNCDGEFDLLDPITTLKLLGGLSAHPCFALSSFGLGVVGEEIGPDGGTLTTTGLDGTQFTLDIPEGALLGPEFIKMTPVEQISDLPVPGGLVAAVDLQPSGLEFWEPAILTIDPPTDIPPEEQTPFLISLGEFVPHPLVLESSEIQLPLTHLSAAGLAQGPVTDLPPLSSAFDTYTAAVAALVLPQRAALLGAGSGNPQFASDLAELMDSYYDGNLAPGLEVADANTAGLGACPVEIQLVRQAWAFAALGQSIGGQQQYPRLQAALQTLSPYLAGCRQADFERCVQFHDLGAIGRIIAYTRVMTLLGIPDSPSPLDEMIEKCARFEVSFLDWFCTDDVSDICGEGISYRFLTRQHPVFSMSLTPSTGPLASAPLELGAGDWNEHFGCQGYMESPGSTFQILGGGVSVNLLSSRSSRTTPPFRLIINPGIPPETLYLTCDFGGGVDIQHTRLWWEKWCSFHKRDMLPSQDHNPDAICFYNEVPGGWPFAITQRGWHQVDDNHWDLDYVRYYYEAGVYEIGWEGIHINIWHVPLP